MLDCGFPNVDLSIMEIRLGNFCYCLSVFLLLTRCIKMCLVHDLAESIVGDLTPSCGVSKEEKAKREKVNCLSVYSTTKGAFGY